MLRGYRGIVIAAFGWLTLTGQQPSPPAKAEQTQAQARVGDTLSNIATTDNEQAERAKRQPERPPCGTRQYERPDDLCAQWKAADAAADAAWWTVIGSVISAAGLAGVLFALFLAFQSNRIARDSAERQLRAYLSVEPGGINQAVNQLARAPLLIRNNGQTPANGVMVFSKFGLSENPVSFDPKSEGSGGISGERNDATLAPGTERWFFPYANNEFIEPYMGKIADKSLAIVHFGYVSYRDIFDRQQESRFAFYHWGDELSDIGSLRCRFGNSST